MIRWNSRFNVRNGLLGLMHLPVPKTRPRRLPQALESTRGEMGGSGVPKSDKAVEKVSFLKKTEISEIGNV
jgi:hypothetical protein